MVNDIGSLGYSTTQSLGFSAPALGNSAAPVSNQETQPGAHVDKVEVTNGRFASLDSSKQQANLGAASARAANYALKKIDGLLDKIQSQVSFVKNYPPYPAGNEARVQYLKGIEGIRKEIESVTVPPVNNYQPVYYPQKSRFPELDPKTSTDSQVASVGQFALGEKAKINAGFSDLQGQVDQIARKINSDIPQPQHALDAKQLAELVSATLSVSKRTIGNSQN
jgi:hypothetical protein